MGDPRLVVLDSVLVDVVVAVPGLPEPGGDVRARSSRVETGGGFNVAAAAARQGMRVAYAGRLGAGPLSDVARAALIDEGVAELTAPDPARDVGFCLVMVDERGERTFVTAPGAELGLSAGDLGAIALGPGDYLYVSGYNLVYPEVGGAVAQWLTGVPPGVVVALDPGARVADIPEGWRDAALGRADWLLCSVAEARALVGDATAGELAARLRGLAHGVVVHDGERGCWVCDATHPPTHVPGVEVDAVDTNGAGDAHNGALLAGLAAGEDLVAAARWANGAAAWSVARRGPATAPTRDELAEWLEGLTD